MHLIGILLHTHTHLCTPITSIDYNYSNEIIGFIIADSFNKETYLSLLNFCINTHNMPLKVVVSDNTLAVEYALQKLNLMHIICTWHHLKNLKNVLKNSTEIPEIEELIYKITHDLNKDYCIFLLNILKTKVPEGWYQQFIEKYLTKMTLSYGPRPN